MPPSLRDWVPEGHLVWTVLDAVGELDLSAIYADYRDDGRGRPAYEPSMMVALLLYAYARGNRSSRGIERACVEDVAYRVVAGNLAPGSFDDRGVPLSARAAVGRGVLRRAGAVRAGRAGVGRGGGDRWDQDGGQRVERTPIATSGRSRARSWPRRPRSTAARTSSTGPRAATSCPSSCAPARDAARRCARPRSASRANATSAQESAPDEDAPVTVELDPREFVTRPQGRRAWVREGRRALDASASARRRPIAKDRAERLFEACRRLEQELDVEHASHAAYDAWRARGIAADGSRRMAPGMVKPHEPVLGADRADEPDRP